MASITSNQGYIFARLENAVQHTENAKNPEYNPPASKIVENAQNIQGRVWTATGIVFQNDLPKGELMIISRELYRHDKGSHVEMPCISTEYQEDRAFKVDAIHNCALTLNLYYKTPPRKKDSGEEIPGLIYKASRSYIPHSAEMLGVQFDIVNLSSIFQGIVPTEAAECSIM